MKYRPTRSHTRNLHVAYGFLAAVRCTVYMVLMWIPLLFVFILISAVDLLLLLMLLLFSVLRSLFSCLLVRLFFFVALFRCFDSLARCVSLGLNAECGLYFWCHNVNRSTKCVYYTHIKPFVAVFRLFRFLSVLRVCTRVCVCVVSFFFISHMKTRSVCTVLLTVVK